MIEGCNFVNKMGDSDGEFDDRRMMCETTRALCNSLQCLLSDQRTNFGSKIEILMASLTTDG